ncbi:transcription factor 12 [Trichonephila inaurata madagascariensis]|uniref:Transcription factor 12 n=1 Tax=Trichonephila inaurata madagascariensis TaxID=2747483 RepID=A0A8X6JQN8_9ARAC|nr:transcription factor 12 [Trichonephila inaurata madagascariensis]
MYTYYSGSEDECSRGTQFNIVGVNNARDYIYQVFGGTNPEYNMRNTYYPLQQNFIPDNYERTTPPYSVPKSVPYGEPYYVNENVPDTWSSSNTSLNSPNYNYQNSMMPNPPALTHISQPFPTTYLPSDLTGKTDQTNSSFSSSPSTPISSPPPLASAVHNWPGANNRFSTQPTSYTELTSTVNPGGIIEERLDDAINVLRNHAEGTSLLQMQNAVPVGSSPTNVNSLHSNLIQKNLPTALESYPGTLPIMSIQQNGLLNNRGTIMGIPNQTVPSPQSFIAVPISTCESVKMENLPEAKDLSCIQGHEQISVLSPEPIVTPSVSSTSTRKPQSRGQKRPRSVAEEEDESPEIKAAKDRERRHANNARERIRVRDINEAFKELGRMCAHHLNIERASTKLNILYQAVDVINNLEAQVKERNLNPKVACLKRREDEKNDDMPKGGFPNADMQHLIDPYSQMMPHPSSQQVNQHPVSTSHH